MGSIKQENGINIVQDDFYLATAADIVADPSAPDAFVRGIMENVDWVYENGVWKQQFIDESKQLIKKTKKKDLEKVALMIFENYLKRL